MSVLQETTGNELNCDGCGRKDGGPGTDLGIQLFNIFDPNVGGTVVHHYCAGCAERRGLTDVMTAHVAGWTASPPPTVGPNETQDEHEAAMRGEVGDDLGRGVNPPKDDDARRKLEQTGFRHEPTRKSSS